MMSSGSEGLLERGLNAYARAFQRWLPSPFAIAILLSLLAALMAWRSVSATVVLEAWTQGLWNPALLRFGFQAMFMLVMGHVLALAPPVLRLLSRALDWVVKSPRWAPAKVAALSMALGWANWGLGLIAGAILVRGVMDRRRNEGSESGMSRVSLGVLGAAGYTGLLVWHGGLSGSAPLKVAESGHLQALLALDQPVAWLPDTIPLSQTVFAPWSLAVTAAVAVSVVLLFSWLGHTIQPESGNALPILQANRDDDVGDDALGNPASEGWSDKLDTRRWLAYLLGGMGLLGALVWASNSGPLRTLSFVTPDWINMILLGLALLGHGQIRGFLKALDHAISDAAGILVQFPLYFGIMGIVTGTGLGEVLAQALVANISANALPEALFLSSGLLNIFVPSGGGQWAVQGPLVIEACHSLGVPLERGIMAMAFGDELTNMLQPFWALPLLGMTGLSARDILPYTLMVMLVAGGAMVVVMACWM